MRTRKEIVEAIEECSSNSYTRNSIVEVLLDIRDLLQPQTTCTDKVNETPLTLHGMKIALEEIILDGKKLFSTKPKEEEKYCVHGCISEICGACDPYSPTEEKRCTKHTDQYVCDDCKPWKLNKPTPPKSKERECMLCSRIGQKCCCKTIEMNPYPSPKPQIPEKFGDWTPSHRDLANKFDALVDYLKSKE